MRRPPPAPPAATGGCASRLPQPCDDRKGVHLLRLLLGQQLMPFHVVDKLAERDKDAHIDLKVEALDDGLRKGTRHEGSWRERGRGGGARAQGGGGHTLREIFSKQR